MKKNKKIALMAVGDEAWIGGLNYIMNILDGLNSIGMEQSIEVHIFKGRNQKFGDIDEFNKINIKILNIDDELPQFTLLNRFFWLCQRKLMRRIYPRLENFLIKNNFDYVYPATLSNCGGKLNVGSWIADFQYHNFPDGHSKQTTIEAEKTISFIANKMQKVVLSSQHCFKDLKKLFPNSINKTHIMPFSVYINRKYLEFSDFNYLRKKYGIDGRFLMVANLFSDVKNHKTLFEALGILKTRGRIINLVCTGNLVNYAKMEFTNEILQIITKTDIRHQLYILGLIPREDQINLYRMSTAIVQPSIHEGWSTCVEEAKALGKPIFLSNIDVHKEQYPNNLLFFDALNANDLAEKIEANFDWDLTINDFDTINEQKALENYSCEVKKFGRLFLNIANK